MSLDATAREANFKDSWKKYLSDSLETAEDIALMFDKTLSVPNLRGIAVDRWVSVVFGAIDRGTLSSGMLDIYCCTRKDEEGFRLAQLADTVMGYLTDSSSTDGMKKIVFYRSRAQGSWENIGGIAIQEIIESGEMDGPDGTKFKILSVISRFASKV